MISDLRKNCFLFTVSYRLKTEVSAITDIFLVYDVVIPVADGKKIPTSRVNDVAMSADTYMPKFSMAPWASTDCSPVFSKISPFCW